MELKEYNKAGQRTLHWRGSDYGHSYTDRDIDCFEFMNLHGMSTIPMLFEYMKGKYSNYGSVKNRTLAWRERDYVELNDNQLASKRACANYYIYNPTERLKYALMQEDRYEETIKPSGAWFHQYLTAAITGSIHVAAKAAGVEYIPGHRLLEKVGATLTCQDLGLAPDQLFALKYPNGSWRVFAVEAERVAKGGTLGNDKRKRKNYHDNILKYQEYLEGRIFQRHLGVDTGMLCLYVFASAEAEHRFYNAMPINKCGFILTQRVDGFFPMFVPQLPYTKLFTEPWKRHGMSDFAIHSAV